jgi:hypothetical protein
MKKGFLLIAAGFIMTGSAMAQKDKKVVKETAPVIAAPAVNAQPEVQKTDAAKPTEALWVSESAHDFGKIPQGKPVTTEFELKNTGKDSLKLENVQASCGCTTPVWKAGSYAPGEKFKITVGYNAAAEGTFTKPVTITYNGQQKVVTITGTVYATPSTPAPENKGVSKVQD